MLDERMEGVPLAYCFAEKEDFNSISTFLKCVKLLSGNIDALDFLSDDANAYYNSWKEVFGSKAKKRLCSWHVFKNWKQQLKSKVKNNEKEEEILKILILIRNSNSLDKSKQDLEKLIKQLSNDKRTKEFGQYLKSFYLKRIDQWVYADRSVLIPNTNMHIESLHRLIKVIYLNGMRIQKISKCVDILKELTNQKAVDRIVKMVKGRCTKKTR